MLKLGKLIAGVILFFSAQSANAQFDFLMEQGKDIVEIAAVADAGAELIEAMSPDTDAQAGFEAIRDQSNRLMRASSESSNLSDEFRELVNGPKWSNNRIEDNIRQTTGYIRRGKRLLVRLAALGTDGLIAVNGVETNIALTEVQRNQQVLIMQNNQMMNYQLSKELNDSKTWNRFIVEQKNIRRSQAGN